MRMDAINALLHACVRGNDRDLDKQQSHYNRLRTLLPETLEQP